MHITTKPSDIPISSRVSSMLTQWFGWEVLNEMDYSTLARKGVDPRVLTRLQDHGFSRAELQWVIASRTLSHRLAKNEQLTCDESAKAIRAARLTAQAEAVFGDPIKAHRWLSKPKKQLIDHYFGVVS
ncbi:antitoxin Xre-like helix-turn-helix domain-containing protein [Aliivibrio kagoshimensis]|uniref:antitoxin Xre-like helix-turn-helix domain-containing protein n=1 Tax=Aliivibrio kagoshimensis TaxID=2910230 RepID=UPI003D0F6CB1